MSTTLAQTTPDVGLILETQYRVFDGLIAVGFFACFVIGLPGNCLALRYFLHTKKRNLSTLLYIVACSIDIGSTIIHLPVAFNLLSNRAPGLLGNTAFCLLWYFTLLVLQQMSMFLVMLMSLSRAVVIMHPFYKVNKRAVIVSIPVYLVYHCIWNTLYFVHANAYYSTAAALGQVYSESKFYTFYQVNYSACLGIPPIIVFLAFLVSIVNLKKGHITDASQRRNQQASITITYFAAIFLLCNCFTFLNSGLYTLTMAWYKVYPGPVYDNNFMFFYSWLLSELFCTVLNASLNPLLYVWRMKNMKMWILGLLRKRANLVSVVIANSTNQTESEL